MCIVTNHAKKRIKQRLGLKKKAIQPMVDKVFETGRQHSEFTGAAKKYLSKLFLTYKKGSNMRVANNHVFIFTGEVLITVFEFPKRFQKYT